MKKILIFSLSFCALFSCIQKESSPLVSVMSKGTRMWEIGSFPFDGSLFVTIDDINDYVYFVSLQDESAGTKKGDCQYQSGYI